jgi:hypothetical protein
MQYQWESPDWGFGTNGASCMLLTLVHSLVYSCVVTVVIPLSWMKCFTQFTYWRLNLHYGICFSDWLLKFLINWKELQLHCSAGKNVQCTVTDDILIFQCCVMFKVLTAVLIVIQLFWYMMQCQLVKVTDFWRNLCFHSVGFFDNLNLTAYIKKEPIILASRFLINYLV